MTRLVDVSTLEITKGAEHTVAVNYKDGSNNPINLSGFTVNLAFRWDAYRDPRRTPIQAGGFTLTRNDFGADGTISFDLTAMDTDQLPVSSPQQGGPPVNYQLFVGTELILQGYVVVNRNLVEENS